MSIAVGGAIHRSRNESNSRHAKNSQLEGIDEIKIDK